MWRREGCTGCWWGNLRGDQDTDGRIILRWIFRKLGGGGAWGMDGVGTGKGRGAGTFEYGKEL
jgi:hypothetical protein